MKKYECNFIGRTKDAIGIFYPIRAEVEAENPEEANVNLYDKYDHIHQLVIFELTDSGKNLVYNYKDLIK